MPNKCRVCEDVTKTFTYYGVFVCNNCKKFIQRSYKISDKLKCSVMCDGKVTPTNRGCRRHRFLKFTTLINQSPKKVTPLPTIVLPPPTIVLPPPTTVATPQFIVVSWPPSTQQPVAVDRKALKIAPLPAIKSTDEVKLPPADPNDEALKSTKKTFKVISGRTIQGNVLIRPARANPLRRVNISQQLAPRQLIKRIPPPLRPLASNPMPVLVQTQDKATYQVVIRGPTHKTLQKAPEAESVSGGNESVEDQGKVQAQSGIVYAEPEEPGSVEGQIEVQVQSQDLEETDAKPEETGSVEAQEEVQAQSQVSVEIDPAEAEPGETEFVEGKEEGREDLEEIDQSQEN